MELENIKTQTTWSDAAESINSNNLKIVTEVTKLQSATYKNKGYFKTFSDLQSAFPTAMVGSKAYVGLSYPYTIYLWQNNAWVNSGTGGDESITMDQFYTKDETDSQISALEKATDSKLTELSEETSARFERSAESVAERFEVVDTEIEQLKRGEAYVFGETLAFRNYADAMVQGNTLTL